MADRKKRLKVIWGMARELGMEKEDVYTLLYQQSGKEHMSDCSEAELSRTVQAMILLKERRTNRPGMITGRQRYKIRELERSLGWTENQKRLRAFIKKYYHVDNMDWLTEEAASNLIEALKKMVKRTGTGEAEAVVP